MEDRAIARRHTVEILAYARFKDAGQQSADGESRETLQARQVDGRAAKPFGHDGGDGAHLDIERGVEQVLKNCVVEKAVYPDIDEKARQRNRQAKAARQHQPCDDERAVGRPKADIALGVRAGETSDKGEYGEGRDKTEGCRPASFPLPRSGRNPTRQHQKSPKNQYIAPDDRWHDICLRKNYGSQGFFGVVAHEVSEYLFICTLKGMFPPAYRAANPDYWGLGAFHQSPPRAWNRAAVCQ